MRINTVQPVTYSRVISQVQPVSKIMKITGKACDALNSEETQKESTSISGFQTSSLSNKQKLLDILI